MDFTVHWIDTQKSNKIKGLLSSFPKKKDFAKKNCVGIFSKGAESIFLSEFLKKRYTMQKK